MMQHARHQSANAMLGMASGGFPPPGMMPPNSMMMMPGMGLPPPNMVTPPRGQEPEQTQPAEAAP